MKPPRAFFDKDLLPIDVARLELRNGRMSPIRTSQRSAHAKSALGEIQAVSNGAADAIVFNPANVTLIDAALEHQILDQAPHGIVGESCNECRVQAEAAPQTARDVVFATAFPSTELACRGDTRIPRVESQHDFAQAHQ